MEPNSLQYAPDSTILEHVIYIEENRLWYRNGATPLVVRVLGRGEKVPPLPSVKADSYMEAFEAMYGHPASMPALVREKPRVVLA